MFRNNFYSRRAFCCSCLCVWSIVYHSIMLQYNYRYSGLSRQVREINVYCQNFFNATHSIARYGRDRCLRRYFGARSRFSTDDRFTWTKYARNWGRSSGLTWGGTENYFKYFHHLSAMKFLLFERCFFFKVEGRKQFPSDFCSKVCKSKGGLTRHQNNKHPSEQGQSSRSLPEPMQIVSSEKVNIDQWYWSTLDGWKALQKRTYYRGLEA